MRVNLRCLKDSLQELSVHQMLSDLTALREICMANNR